MLNIKQIGLGAKPWIINKRTGDEKLKFESKIRRKRGKQQMYTETRQF